MRSRLITIIVPLLVLALGVIGTAAAAPGASGDAPGADSAAERRAEVLAYWTPERVRNAVPRLPVVNGTPTAKPDHAGGPKKDGGGSEGGGTSDGTVTGAPWEESSAFGTVGETTGKVLFKMNGTNYVCSGSTVTSPSGASIVLTAGHCLHDGDGTASWASNWMFVPAYEDHATFTCDRTEYGCWTAANLVTTTTWYATGDFSDDVGFAVMDPGGLSGNANLVDVVGAHSIAFSNGLVDQGLHAFGYPQARPYRGDDLIYCAGTGIEGRAGTAGLGCDMTGGSSGGPWYAGFESESGTAVSVNSHIYRSIKDVMFGPVFDEDEQAAYDLARGAANTGARSSG